MTYTSLALKKNCKKDMTGLPEYKLAVMGDCATQHMSMYLRGYAYEEGINLNVLDTDYNQILPMLMDSDSAVYRFNADAVLIVMCTEKLYERYMNTPLSERKDFADTVIGEITDYWNLYRKNSKGRIIQFNFPEISDRIYGNYENLLQMSFIYALRKLNLLLGEKASEFGNVFIADASYIKNEMGAGAFSDSVMYYTAKIPYTMDGMIRLCIQVVEIIKALNSKLKKCVVLDLDNTLWGGVVGDDGLSGIEIGELGTGRAFLSFQHWLLELKKSGIILCICSKNDEDKAKEPFIKHPEMAIRLEDIAMFVANWEDKASNIKNISETLNLGLDSFVFIDDNPFERDQVKSMLPMVTVPEMPKDPAEYVNCLQGLNLFERISASSQDEDRTRQYREEASRVTLSKAFENYGDYLKALNMKGTVSPFTEFNYPRIAQLSQRSNQFNLRTKRYTEEDVRSISLSGDYEGLTFSLSDKFGEHGLISVAVIKINADTAFIENWFMSCRVLKRTMEQFIINEIVKKCKSRGVRRIDAEYIRTPKNNMVSDIYERMGFSKTAEGRYSLETEGFDLLTTYIENN